MNVSTVRTPNEQGDAVVRLPRSQGVAYAAAFVVEIFMAVVGNSIVVLVFGKTKELRKRKSHWLLINLALADLSVAVIAGPFWLYFLASRCDLWEYEDNIEELISLDSVFLLSLSASLVNLLVISVERLYATLWPFKHRLLGAREYRAMIASVWMLPLFLPCVSIAERYGRISLDLFNCIWLVSYCSIILMIVLSYATIWAKMKLHKDGPQQVRANIPERKLTASLFMVTAASLLTTLPGVVFSVIVFLPPLDKTLSKHSSLHILNSAALVIYASPVINSVIYSFKLPRFRRAAIRLAYCRSFTKKKRVPAVHAITGSSLAGACVVTSIKNVNNKERQSETTRV